MSDTVKLLGYYLLAFLVVGGGYAILYATRSEAAARDLQLLIGGLMGAAVASVFQSQVQTQTARQQERALLTNPANGQVASSAAGPSNESVEDGA